MTLDPAALGWRTEASPSLAFGAPGHATATGDVDVIRWRLEVAGPVSTWEAELAARRAAVETAAVRQEVAARRLAAFASQPAGLTFAGAAGTAVGAATPEMDLARLLSTPPEADGLAFGPIGDLKERWRSAVERLEGALDRVGRFLRGLAVVETAIDGVPLARTAIEVDGDLRSVWRRGVTDAAAALHAGAIEVALAARRQIARGLRLLLEGAALVATLPALAANPAGLLVALPAIWRFIERVMDDPEPA